MTTITTTTVYRCQSCDEISETPGPTLYECAACGHVFNKNNGNGAGHQCPECNKFAGKSAEQSCSECEEGEVYEEQAVLCTCCDKWHTV